ncbi:Hypothetical predicted protein [Paramuricea clavata]|uniref:Uncharacterized protein n=1 Tax=Paramuricea clavata TaxID=317549 RepID=A0A6S7H849_PARCT|nr:Hypothetical predicted protein [Paramuricea clavata]
MSRRKAIANGCTTQEINGENISTGFVETDDEETFMNNLFEKEDDANSQVKQPELQDVENNSESEESDTTLDSRKRIVPVNSTPKFVENKRKKLKKQLSAKQRDMVLMNAAKKEIDLKTSIPHGLLESNKGINSAMSEMADSIRSLGTGLVQGFGLLAQALSQNQQQQHHPAFGNFGVNYQPLAGFPNTQYHSQHINHQWVATQSQQSESGGTDKGYVTLE